MLKFLLVLIISSSHAWAKGSYMIEDVIQDYFQGYQQADTKLIQKAFHSETRLLSVDNEKISVTEMKDWLVSLDGRHARGETRKGDLQIVSIDATENTAAVKLIIRFPAFVFTDYLSLLKIDGNWKIVGKIYHFKEI